MKKIILDACCGGRHFWFNKKHPNVLYVDNRVRQKGHNWHRKNHSVLPDKIVDFRDMPFKDNSFKVVVFDPPHIIGSESGVINKQYGWLEKDSWREDIKKGLAECFRVLKKEGIMIFKWNECRIPLKEILKLTPYHPLFGHKSGKQQLTHWLCFMKLLNNKG